MGVVYGWFIFMVIMVVYGDIFVWGWLLFIVNLLWIIVYDMLYVMVDWDDDVIIGIKFSVILFGCFDKFIVGMLEVIVLVMLVVVFELIGWGMLVYVGFVVVVVLFIY